ncbi:Uncharacterised protein [Citrobacter koseri]|uniref:Uncharacterized protein n=1 Tax=Citrobacter koseri TaxID=545 RepID=A0A3S4J2E7_CITKO|nr:Uncharacterised protein [Citrobacter koseri]
MPQRSAAAQSLPAGGPGGRQYGLPDARSASPPADRRHEQPTTARQDFRAGDDSPPTRPGSARPIVRPPPPARRPRHSFSRKSAEKMLPRRIHHTAQIERRGAVMRAGKQLIHRQRLRRPGMPERLRKSREPNRPLRRMGKRLVVEYQRFADPLFQRAPLRPANRLSQFKTPEMRKNGRRTSAEKPRPVPS